MEIFWKAQILKNAESDIVYVKWGDNEDSATGIWLQSVFAEL